MVYCLRVLIRTSCCLLSLSLLLHCSNEPAAAPEELKAEELGPVAAMIRNPVDGGVVDTNTVARMDVEESTYEFGTVKKGAIVNHEFEFENKGRVPLLITDARSTCGCTIPSYPKQPIPPGESGVIKVSFDTKNKSGWQEKPVMITANTYPAKTTLYVKGRVDTK